MNKIGRRPQRPPKGSAWVGPQIPRILLHDMEAYTVEKKLNSKKGGIYETEKVEKYTFLGAVLPLSNEDKHDLPDGTVTVNTQKIYTNGAVLYNGQTIRDGTDGKEYTVGVELTHVPIHGMKRYTVTAQGVTVPSKVRV